MLRYLLDTVDDCLKLTRGFHLKLTHPFAV